ncbi:site-specific integrase [Shewanella sp. MMG014]|uniref:tyrosine-type recombinase/integrase n=1 Tax=Shewanella sp. MMG014 TaxID=2822691 RepID=UPI001B38BF72|nr:site-specific integrase [Shewanella sp. MMG014]MBQ4892161.1 site-specific integrase [Shewanella sp. MMG014]
MSKAIGVQERERKRKKHHFRVKEIAKQLQKKHFVSDSAFQSQCIFDSHWSELIKELRNQYSKITDFKRGFNSCVLNLSERADIINPKIEIPTFFIQQKAETSIRNQNVMKRCWAFNALYIEWMHELKCCGHSNDIEVAFRSALLSFICHSGISNIHLVLAFANAIITPLKIQSFKNKPFIKLIVDEKISGYHSNIRHKEHTSTQFKCYLSPFTLVCIKHFKQLSEMIEHNPWSPPNTRKTIYNFLIKPATNKKFLATNLANLINSSMTVIESHNNVRISQALLEFALGNTKAYSLPDDNLARLESPIVNEVKGAQLYSITTKKDSASIRHSTLLPSTGFFKQLVEALKPTGSTKLTSRSLIIKLKELEKNLYLSTSQTALLNWYIFKLSTCKPSTIRTYHSTISRKWLHLTDTHALETFDEQDFQDLYRELIEQTASPNRKSSLAARLSDFHAFATAKFKFPLLIEPIYSGYASKAHTNAGFIDETLFAALLTTIVNLEDINDEEKLVLQSIVIISFRCGLRLSEVIKLRVGDLEPSDIGWMSIRNNRFGNNKSSAALRRVPLFELLLESEKTIINDTIPKTNENNESINKSRPLFTIGLNRNEPVNKQLISHFVKVTLRELSGLNHFVFHHLRHTAISRLQLMVELCDAGELIPEAVPYSGVIAQEIIDRICGQNSRNKYYAIAAFVGHSSPETCFTNYFHFCDFIIGRNMLKMNLDLNRDQICSLHLASRRKATEIIKNGSVQGVTAEELLPNLLKKLKITPVKSLLPAKKLKSKLTNYQSNEKATSISLDTCYAALRQIEKGCSPTEIAYKFAIPLEKIEKFNKNAKYLMNKKTTYGHPRLRTSHAINKLLPVKPRNQQELKWLSKVVINVRKVYSSDKENITWAISYALNNKCNSKPGILFSNPDDLTRFIRTLEFTIPKEQWRIQTLSIPQGSSGISWKQTFKGIQTIKLKPSSKTGRSGKGAVWLELRHSQEKEITKTHSKSKYSSTSILYLFHMMAIMMMNDN